MAKKQAPGGADDSSGGMVFVGLLLIGFMLWMAYHTKVATLVLGIRGIEAWIIHFFTNNVDETRGWIKYVRRDVVTIGDLARVSSEIGGYFRWVFTPVLLGIGVWLFRNSPTERFKTTYSDKTLPPTVAKLYPWMQISIKNDFAKMDADKGNWAIARTERQFARMHKLRDERGEISRERTTSVLVKQMGPLWLGHKAMKPYSRALFALFITRINKDFKAGDALLIQLATSAATPSGALDLTNVDELIAKYLDTRAVKLILKNHAYERSVLMSCLERARGGETGKDLLPPNWFLWVKGEDRLLWYALSDVGRRTFHPECAGISCHWLAEKTMKRRLEMPWVKNAVEGLVLELSKFTNDDDEEGLVDTDDLIAAPDHLPMPDIPSPEETEVLMKSGKGRTLPKLPWSKS